MELVRISLFDLLKFGAIIVLFVLWTEHSYQRGVQYAEYACEYEVST